MALVWYWLVAAGLTIYILLDGYDLGAGILHYIAGRNSGERRQILDSIAPFWDGNEVWLLAGGGTLYFAFPVLYASAFSGFYLPLMIVLWLLILRGIAIEFRNHFESPLWTPFWDAVFSFSSALLAIFFGAALGNVIRGVPLDANGEFFLPLWTDFQVSANPGVLDWYTILIGVFALLVLGLHGALWLQYKTSSQVEERSRKAGARLWWMVLACTALATIASSTVQPSLAANFARYPLGYAFPLAAIAGFAYIRLAARQISQFMGSCLFITGMMLSAVFGVFPNVLPGTLGNSLTIENAGAARYGLTVGLIWWLPALLLALAYAAFLHRRFAGKVAV